MSDLKQLPFCAKCGREKETWLHDKRFSPKKHSLQATQDCREVYKLMKHEFDPCVTLKEYEEKTEKQSVCIDGLKQGLLIEIKTRQEFEQKLFNLKKRDERLAKELRKVVLDVEILDLDEVIPVIEKVVGELKKKGGLK